jgi:Transposase and inactivated derivatives
VRDDVLASGRYAGRVRYADGGGLTAAARTKREKVRFTAAEMFVRGLAPPQVARQLRVSHKSAYAWHRTWKAGGVQALASRGPGGSRCQLTADQLTRLEHELDAGPAAHGWVEDQRWTLARIAKLIKGRFGISYSLRGWVVVLRCA